jgi:predicted transcriptional regulator
MARKPKAEAQTQETETTSATSGDHLLDLAVNLVSSYVSRNQVPMADLPAVIGMFHGALAQAAGRSGAPIDADRKPAVPVKKSIGDDFIICLEDGKKLKMLKRYLRSNYNMSPEEYRAKWGLPADYPMVAPAYARQRSEFAKKIGLGRVPSSSGRGRKRKSG